MYTTYDSDSSRSKPNIEHGTQLTLVTVRTNIKIPGHVIMEIGFLGICQHVLAG